MEPIILFGGLLLLVLINLLFFRPKRVGYHDLQGRFVPPGFNNYGEYEYSNRMSEQTTTVINTLLFVTILFLAIAFFSRENRDTSQIGEIQTEQSLGENWASN